jgi:hypothetical protein
MERENCIFFHIQLNCISTMCPVLHTQNDYSRTYEHEQIDYSMTYTRKLSYEHLSKTDGNVPSKLFPAKFLQ